MIESLLRNPYTRKKNPLTVPSAIERIVRTSPLTAQFEKCENKLGNRSLLLLVILATEDIDQTSSISGQLGH